MALAHVRRQPLYLVKLMWEIGVADCTVTIGAIWHLMHKEEDAGNNHANAAAAAAVGNNAVTAGGKDVGAAATPNGAAANPANAASPVTMTVSRSTPPVADALGGGFHVQVPQQPVAAEHVAANRYLLLSLRPRLHHCHRLQ